MYLFNQMNHSVDLFPFPAYVKNHNQKFAVCEPFAAISPPCVGRGVSENSVSVKSESDDYHSVLCFVCSTKPLI